MIEKRKKYAVIKITHGSGAEFMAVSVIARELASVYERLFIICYNKYFSDSLASELSNVESFGIDTEPQLMTDVIRNKDDYDLFIDHPYNTGKFALRSDNFYNAYRELVGLEKRTEWSSKGTKDVPHLNIPDNENIEKFVSDHKKFVIVQFHGGQNPMLQGPVSYDQNGNPARPPYVYEEKGLKRHYPLEKAEEVVSMLNKEGYEVLQYTLSNEPHVKGSIFLQQEQPQLFYYKLAEKADGIITIDSSLQHLAVHAMKPMVVVWCQTDVGAFGYDNDWTVNLKREYSPVCPLMSGLPDTPIVSYVSPKEIIDAFDKLVAAKSKVSSKEKA